MNLQVVVWLASGKELLEQAVLAFKDAWFHLGTRPVQVGTMWGECTPDLDRFSDGTPRGRTGEGMGGTVADPIRIGRLASLVECASFVFDEAHQSIARTYRSIGQ